MLIHYAELEVTQSVGIEQILSQHIPQIRIEHKRWHEDRQQWHGLNRLDEIILISTLISDVIITSLCAVSQQPRKSRSYLKYGLLACASLLGTWWAINQQQQSDSTDYITNSRVVRFCRTMWHVRCTACSGVQQCADVFSLRWPSS